MVFANSLKKKDLKKTFFWSQNVPKRRQSLFQIHMRVVWFSWSGLIKKVAREAKMLIKPGDFHLF